MVYFVSMWPTQTDSEGNSKEKPQVLEQQQLPWTRTELSSGMSLES